MTTTSQNPATSAESLSWEQREAAVYFQAARRVPVVIERGEGTAVFDPEGNRYLDFVAGIATNSLGHRHPAVVQAVQEQADRLIHISNVFFSEPQVQLAEVTATGTERYKTPFGPLPPGFIVVPFNDVEALRAAVTPKTCAILLEPIQGEGGVNLPAEGYLQAVRRLCDEQNVLLMLDEIQTGVGRCGTLWAYEQYGIEPDVMTLAKGLAGGVPIGAILAKEQVAACFVPGDHGSTFGGNPLATAAGYSVLKYIVDNDLPAEVARKGEQLLQRLHGIEDRHHEIAEVRGRGLLCAVQFQTDIADAVMRACTEQGLLVNMLRGNTVRFSPPLTVSD